MRRRREKLTEEAAFNRLRDEICLRAGGAPKVVVIASARRGEGRTTVAAGLARAFARVGDAPPTLADFDLHQPALHAAFGAAVSPGVSEILRGKADLSAALQPVEGGAVSLLAAGAESQHAVPLMNSPAFVALLAELRSRSVVIVDAPPLESGAEAEILAAAANGIVLVVCADVTAEREAQFAAARLTAVGGGSLLGVALNQARRGESLLSAAPSAPLALSEAEPTETPV